MYMYLGWAFIRGNAVYVYTDSDEPVDISSLQLHMYNCTHSSSIVHVLVHCICVIVIVII